MNLEQGEGWAQPFFSWAFLALAPPPQSSLQKAGPGVGAPISLLSAVLEEEEEEAPAEAPGSALTPKPLPPLINSWNPQKDDQEGGGVGGRKAIGARRAGMNSTPFEGRARDSIGRGFCPVRVEGLTYQEGGQTGSGFHKGEFKANKEKLFLTLHHL